MDKLKLYRVYPVKMDGTKMPTITVASFSRDGAKLIAEDWMHFKHRGINLKREFKIEQSGEVIIDADI